MVSHSIARSKRSLLPCNLGEHHSDILTALIGPLWAMLLKEEDKLYQAHIAITSTKPAAIKLKKVVIHPSIERSGAAIHGTIELIHPSLMDKANELEELISGIHTENNVISSVLGILLRACSNCTDLVALLGESILQVIDPEKLPYAYISEGLSLSDDTINIFKEKYAEGINKIQNRIVFITLLV
jgi:hypothetical protein